MSNLPRQWLADERTNPNFTSSQTSHGEHLSLLIIKETITFRAVTSPARQFETRMRIGYGLAEDGLCNKKERLKHLGLGAWVPNRRKLFAGPAALLAARNFGLLARIARWKGKDKELEKYYQGLLEPLRDDRHIAQRKKIAQLTEA